MNTRFSLSILTCILLSYSGFSQNGYIVKGDSITTGVELIGGSRLKNSQYIHQLIDGKVVEHFPHDLAEYGIKNGEEYTIYESRKVMIKEKEKRVFLEILNRGELTLFYYEEEKLKTFFLQDEEGNLIEISKKNFKETLIKKTKDRKWITDFVEVTRYRRKSLTRLVSSYNDNDKRPFPYFRYGLVTGFSKSALETLLVPAAANNKLEGSNTSGLLGIYGDFPLEGYFSINLGVNLSKNSFSMNTQTPDSDIDAVVNLTTFDIPILFRYTLPTSNWRPFFNAGPIFIFNLQNSNHLYEAVNDIEVNAIFINEININPFISDQMYGYSLGIGMLRKLDNRNMISAELRSGRFAGSSSTLGMNQFTLLLGYSF